MDGYPPDYEVDGQMSLFDNTGEQPGNKQDRGRDHYVVFVQDDAFDYPPIKEKKIKNE